MLSCVRYTPGASVICFCFSYGTWHCPTTVYRCGDVYICPYSVPDLAYLPVVQIYTAVNIPKDKIAKIVITPTTGPVVTALGFPTKVNWATIFFVKLLAASVIASAVEFPHAWLRAGSSARATFWAMALLRMAALPSVPSGLDSRNAAR